VTASISRWQYVTKLTYSNTISYANILPHLDAPVQLPSFFWTIKNQTATGCFTAAIPVKKTRICILKIDAKHHEKSGVSYSKSRPAPHCRVLPPDICWMLHDDSCNCFHVAMVTNNPGDRKQQLALYRRCAVKTENQHAALLGWKFSSICVWPLRYLKFADTAYCRRLCHRVWGCYLSWTVTLWERHDGVQA